MVTIIQKEDFGRLRIPPVTGPIYSPLPQYVYVTSDIPVHEDTIKALKNAQAQGLPMPNVAMCYKNAIFTPAKDAVQLFARPQTTNGFGKKNFERKLDEIITFDYTPHAIAFGQVKELSDPKINELFGFNNLHRYLLAKQWLHDDELMQEDWSETEQIKPREKTASERSAQDDMWFTAYAGTPDYYR